MTKNSTPMKVDTLYEFVMKSLKNQIRDGVYEPGDKLPSEMELCEQFSVSRITIRRAIAELEKEEYLKVLRGKGTFITRDIRRNISLLDIGGFGNGTGSKGSDITKKIISKRVFFFDKDTEVAKKFEASEGLYCLEYIRFISDRGEPFAIDYGYFPTDLYPNVESVIDQFSSTFEMLDKVYSIYFKKSQKIIEYLPSVYNLFTEEEKEFLMGNKDSGIISVKKRILNEENIVVHYSHFYMLAENVKFSLEYIR